MVAQRRRLALVALKPQSLDALDRGVLVGSAGARVVDVLEPLASANAASRRSWPSIRSAEVGQTKICYQELMGGAGR